VKQLIDWFRVAVTTSDELEMSPSSVGHTSALEVTLMEPQLLQEQLKVRKADLPAWNNIEHIPCTKRNDAEETVEKLVDLLHKRGPRGLKIPAPAKKDKKPKE
jgi:hypothetical protein